MGELQASAYALGYKFVGRRGMIDGRKKPLGIVQTIVKWTLDFSRHINYS
jgi:hypothetical protein